MLEGRKWVEDSEIYIWKKLRVILISQNISIPIEEFLITIKLIIDSTFFTFNKIYYRFLALPMDSLLFPIIVDLVMQDLEEVAIECLFLQLPFYHRYVDDIILAAPADLLDNILQTFNSLHSRLHLIMEVEDGRISVLDIMLIKDNNRNIFDWFHKLSFSRRYLNFNFYHSLNHKKVSFSV